MGWPMHYQVKDSIIRQGGRKVKGLHIGWLLLCLLGLGLPGMVSAAEYIISDNDVLDVSVYDHPEMKATVRVDGKGEIVLPLLDAVEVRGLTVGEVSRKLTKLLADGYIINPQVNVFVTDYREQKAAILGQVEKPGLYELRPQTTLLELISQAGGLTKEAGDFLTLKRVKADGKPEELVIDLDRLVDQGDTSLNVQIFDGDKMFIAKAGIFYVTGEVKKPDAYKYQDHLTLIKAIAMAGGFSDTASPGSVNIVRKKNGKEEVIRKADMDELIQPEDVIVVPESFF